MPRMKVRTPRNPQDSTRRNIVAATKRTAKLDEEIRTLKARVKTLEQYMARGER